MTRRSLNNTEPLGVMQTSASVRISAKRQFVTASYASSHPLTDEVRIGTPNWQLLPQNRYAFAFRFD
jgi:hypothetical protein